MLHLLAKNKLLILSLYFLLITILFFLPGSALPKEDWLSKIYFDKWVHVGLFMILSFLSCWAFLLKRRKDLVMLLLATICYGFLVEIIQGTLVANRSYDLGDLTADTCGSILGITFWLWRYIKK